MHETFAVGTDVNMTFAAAANRLTPGLDRPTYLQHPEFDLKLPGSWLVDLTHTTLNERLPSPLTARGERPEDPARYTTTPRSPTRWSSAMRRGPSRRTYATNTTPTSTPDTGPTPREGGRHWHRWSQAPGERDLQKPETGRQRPPHAGHPHAAALRWQTATSDTVLAEGDRRNHPEPNGTDYQRPSNRPPLFPDGQSMAAPARARSVSLPVGHGWA